MREPAICCAAARPRAAGTAGRRNLERRAWNCLFADGLLAIAFGCALAGAGAVTALETWLSLPWFVSPAVFVVSVGAGWVTLVAGKRRITAPRMAWANLGRLEQGRVRGALPVLGAGAAMTASETLGTPWPLIACAAAVLLTGALRLAAFVRRYPLPGETGHRQDAPAVSGEQPRAPVEPLSLEMGEAWTIPAD
ncbi:MAG: hypothetical protein R6X13_12510 [bacterium]